MISTNFDKYHPGYFGKVGMRRFHLTRNALWGPIINVDKLWTLVPAEEKKGLTESSDVVPVIDTLAAGYGKVLGNGQCVHVLCCYLVPLTKMMFCQAPQTPLYREGTDCVSTRREKNQRGGRCCKVDCMISSCRSLHILSALFTFHCMIHDYRMHAHALTPPQFPCTLRDQDK